MIDNDWIIQSKFLYIIAITISISSAFAEIAFEEFDTLEKKKTSLSRGEIIY